MAAKKKFSFLKKEKIPGLEEILLKYWPQISFRVKNSIGRSTPDWEDIGSEILLNVIEALRKKTFRGQSSLGTFIYSITTNKIIDFIRQKKKVLREIPAPDLDSDPYFSVEKGEKAKLVSMCLKELKPKYADILYLKYYLDLPQTEIAKIYGVSPTWVSVMVIGARKTLKSLMENLSSKES
jgi:RNA polymerase sigma-70 factor (ECF subfamily)